MPSLRSRTGTSTRVMFSTSAADITILLLSNTTDYTGTTRTTSTDTIADNDDL